MHQLTRPHLRARAGSARIFDNSPIGPLRLFRAEEAAQAAWWLPLALAGAFLEWSTAATAGASKRIVVLSLCGWTAIYWLVFSFAGGVVHFYYLAVLGPPLAALAGIGVSELWHRWRTAAPRPAVLPALVATTALWQAYLAIGQAGADPRGWVTWLCVGSTATALLVGLLLLAKPGVARGRTQDLWNGVGIACCGALMAMPTACALSTVLVRPNVSAPIANLGAFHGNSGEQRRRWAGNPAATEKLLSFLQGRRVNERFLVAVPSSTTASAPDNCHRYAGDCHGRLFRFNPILTPPDLQRLVETGQLRFVMIGDARRWTRRHASQQAIDDWVRSHGKPVDPALWRADTEPAREASSASAYPGARRDPPELYDLRG
jgi:4-amino-4-deoxy-L-arabinose transferase-like glycosyltransferase